MGYMSARGKYTLPYIPYFVDVVDRVMTLITKLSWELPLWGLMISPALVRRRNYASGERYIHNASVHDDSVHNKNVHNNVWFLWQNYDSHYDTTMATSLWQLLISTPNCHYGIDVVSIMEQTWTYDKDYVSCHNESCHNNNLNNDSRNPSRFKVILMIVFIMIVPVNASKFADMFMTSITQPIATAQLWQFSL
jgi:hypothetical protein